MSLRAFAVSLMHGMVGSTALILLTLDQFDSLWQVFPLYGSVCCRHDAGHGVALRLDLAAVAEIGGITHLGAQRPEHGVEDRPPACHFT